ncbi:MAG: hypothetical protein KAK04_05505, partial [Cyclobacteriaceae bacterium]|nr:hypothetical protein [Cyclobacteriaceae bacterium]
MIYSKSKYIIILLLLTISFSHVFGQRSIKKASDDKFEIEIDRENNSPITILQVTDLHLGGSGEGKWKKDLITL